MRDGGQKLVKLSRIECLSAGNLIDSSFEFVTNAGAAE